MHAERLVLHHALYGDDFDQTPVSKILRGKLYIYYIYICIYLVLRAMQHRQRALEATEGLTHPPSPGSLDVLSDKKKQSRF